MIHTKRPTCSPALSVWEAWAKQRGRQPNSVEVLNPTRNQKARGVPRFVVNGYKCVDSVAAAKAGDWEDVW